MIDFNFEPQAIDLIKSIDVIKEHGESLSQVSLPSHEDIERELQSEEKNIQSLGKEIVTANEDVFSELKNMFSSDFDSKISLFTQLVSANLTEENFPIKQWNEVAEKLDYLISYNDVKIISNAIENQNNEETKEALIYNLNMIVKELLNSKRSFKYNNGKNIIENYIHFMEKLGKSENEIDDNLKYRTYENKEVKLKNSNANLWKFYLIMNDIENNKEKITKTIKEFEGNDIFNFMMETDLFINYSYNSKGRRNITSIKVNKLRELIILMDDELLQKEFFPHFLGRLKKFGETAYLNKENQENFNFLMLELEKGLHCLTLTSKLSISKTDAVKEKKIKI